MTLFDKIFNYFKKPKLKIPYYLGYYNYTAIGIEFDWNMGIWFYKCRDKNNNNFHISAFLVEQYVK